MASVVGRYLKEEAQFLAAVERGIAAAERGEFIEEEAMDARLNSVAVSHERLKLTQDVGICEKIR